MKNHAQNVVRKLNRDPIIKNQNWTHLWMNILKRHAVRFNCMYKWRSTKISQNRSYLLRPLSLFRLQSFFKKQERPGTKLIRASFSAWILKKIFVTFYSITWPNFMYWLPLLFEILDNMPIVITCFPVCDVINFELNLSFLNKLVPYMTKKSEQKFEYLKNEAIF